MADTGASSRPHPSSRIRDATRIKQPSFQPAETLSLLHNTNPLHETTQSQHGVHVVLHSLFYPLQTTMKILGVEVFADGSSVGSSFGSSVCSWLCPSGFSWNALVV